MEYSVAGSEPIIMTLDAGGTNFIFSAIQQYKEVIEPIRLTPHKDDLERCLGNIIRGFEQVQNQLKAPAAAISFAFPGPADYPNGIIGDLPNLNAFRGGVPLGPILQAHFNIPVFINNDANLFAYGEALFGFLPAMNESLKKANSPKRFRHLIGVTLGTGFGVGLVAKNQLITGDNSSGGEGWLLRNRKVPDYNVEEHLSGAGIRRSYAQKAALNIAAVGMPKDIGDIAKGLSAGNRAAAIATYDDFGQVLGEALATIITLFDGLVVLGGGISGAFDLFAPSMLAALHSKFKLHHDGEINRVIQHVFNLEDAKDKAIFLKGNRKELSIPGTTRSITYDSFQRTGVGCSKHSTSHMIGLGAFALALQQLRE